MRLFVTDPKTGKKSASLTIALAAFIIASFKLLTSGLVYGSIQISAVDAGLLIGYLGLCLGLYWGRKNTDATKNAKEMLLSINDKEKEE